MTDDNDDWILVTIMIGLIMIIVSVAVYYNGVS